jgi:2-dehydro-3-deoxygluconokinase
MPAATTPGRRRFDVTSLGETMLRFTAGGGTSLRSAEALELHVGGAESNVCSTLAQLGRSCGWYGRLPANPLGDRVMDELSRRGVDVSAVERPEGERIGLYFVERVADRAGRSVVYDRRGSAASRMRPDTVPWPYLTDARLLHLTGITPALSDSCAAVVAATASEARRAGVAVCLDVNYRPQLWDAGTARAALEPLIGAVDLLICAARDARALLGLHGDDEHLLQGLRDLSGASCVVLTLAGEGAIAADPQGTHRQAAVPTQVIDTIGAGDAMAAGVIDGWLDGSLADGLRRGAALAAIALSQAGDMPLVSRERLDAAAPTS